MMETAFFLMTCAFVGALAALWLIHRELRQHRSWLRDELTAHERTRQALREAAARMRRENRDRFLGLIEEQRGA